MKHDTMGVFEVEQKFRVGDLASVAVILESQGAVFAEEIEQVDSYFAHPSRNFAETDEALRMRRIGDTNLLTYKGPKRSAEVKTRREIELPIASGEEAAEQMREMWFALGFRAVTEVRKTRQVYDLDWQGDRVACALDRVERVGQFVELELVSDEEGLAEAQSKIQSLAGELQLTEVESSSYLALLLRLENAG